MSRSVGAWRLATRLLGRDWRSGELLVLAAALVTAVTAMTAVGFLTDRVSQAVAQRAAESLAADLRLRAGAPLPESHRQLAADHGLRTAELVSMPSVVFAGESSALAALTAAGEGYPLRGRLETAERQGEDATPANGLPGPGEAWAAPGLLARLGVDTGTTVEIGEATFTLTRVLSRRPDEGFNFVDLAPTLLINVSDLDNTGLIRPGSRVTWRQLFAGDRARVARFKAELEPLLDPAERLRDIEDAGPQVQAAMQRSGRFLNLASLVSVLLAAIAVAMSARRYALRHRDRVALMKCLGARQAFVDRVNRVQVLLLALAGGALGIVLGFVAQQVLAWLLRDFIGESLPMPGLSPVWLGLVTSACILGGFALPDLARMGRTPPLRVLRADVEPAPWRHGLAYVAAVAALVALLTWLVRDLALAGAVLAGLLATFAVLGLAGWALVRVTHRFRGTGGAAWRFGLANLARRGPESIAQVVAFGLGIMVLLVLSLVRDDLMDSWRASLPEDAPNRFMINIQAYEVEPIRELLSARGIEVPRFVPMVRARLTAINGTDIGDITFDHPEGERWAQREANLTWAEAVQDGNRLLQGEFWDAGTTAPEVSVEAEFASELGVGVGDTLAFDIAGEPLQAPITSIREVAWDSFRPNFFMVLNASALEGYPGTWINSIHLPPGTEDATLDVMRAFPSVSVIDLDAILAQVRSVMDRAAFAVQAVFAFTLLAGLAVLWAAVHSTRDAREFESALLRSLGASRRRVLAGVVAEFLAIGLLAGVLATAGATLAGYLLATRVYDLEYRFNLGLTLAGPLLGMLFVGLAGWLATRRVVATPPIRVLRSA
ncbi:FtsX-like permease family protein [Marinihelvus fidelis]|uniref:FtsX-like permease family protein n=1 Tax=Marinihelvus fidelis TaxID=2613842 RepID=A0A5N0TE56_9GAMM|nr:FtsX-like permease family protein [Marinihelvus fidelis]KAA9133322.1 FtsX-like permease family protein [Marinihelvus fidelis]